MGNGEPSEVRFYLEGISGGGGGNAKSLRENKSTYAFQSQAESRKFPGACGSSLPDRWAQAHDCQASPKFPELLL